MVQFLRFERSIVKYILKKIVILQIFLRSLHFNFVWLKIQNFDRRWFEWSKKGGEMAVTMAAKRDKTPQVKRTMAEYGIHQNDRYRSFYHSSAITRIRPARRKLIRSKLSRLYRYLIIFISCRFATQNSPEDEASISAPSTTSIDKRFRRLRIFLRRL